MEPTPSRPTTPTGTGARKAPEKDPTLAAGFIRSTSLKLETGESAAFGYPEDFVRKALIPWLSAAKHHVTIEPGAEPGTTLVSKTSAPAKRQPGQLGRSKSNESIEYRLMGIKPGHTLNLGAANYFSVAAIASTIKSRGQASFHITTNDEGETLAKRSTGVFITRRDGTQREADPKTLRGEYPFRAMEDGDSYNIAEHDHQGIHAMTLYCRRYQKIRGWGFTPTLNEDGSITIQCHVQGEKPRPIPKPASQT